MIARGTVLIASANRRVQGKPRPVIVVQDSAVDFADTIIVIPLTARDSEDRILRPVILPDNQNGLQGPSSAMIHRVGAIYKSEIGKVAGSLSGQDMAKIDLALSLILGLGRA